MQLYNKSGTGIRDKKFSAFKLRDSFLALKPAKSAQNQSVGAHDGSNFQSDNEDASSSQSEPVKKAEVKANPNTGKSQFFGDAKKFQDGVRPAKLSDNRRGMSLGGGPNFTIKTARPGHRQSLVGIVGE